VPIDQAITSIPSRAQLLRGKAKNAEALSEGNFFFEHNG
jgi:hypothetical protein